MGKLIPVKYSSRVYPAPIVPKLTEIAGNFDVTKVLTFDGPFSLHTEFSFSSRKFRSPALQGLEILKTSHKSGIPQLWHGESWAKEFVQFVVAFCNGRIPKVIEIHPSFDDYSTLTAFLDCYTVFEKDIVSIYPDVILLVENRSGTLYSDGNFVLSKSESLIQFSKMLDDSKLRLRITLDIPQLFTAHNASKSDISPLMNDMRSIRHNISGIHLWGKKKDNKGTRRSHIGDLNTYFHNDPLTKEHFLYEMCRLIDDDTPRFFVPEVNSSQEDFVSIIQDLLSAGIIFT